MKMYKNTNSFFLIFLFFSSVVLAASPPDLATIIDTNPSFEIQDRASMGLGDDALVTSEMIQFDLDSIRGLLIIGQSFKLHLPGDPDAKVFHVESIEENVPGVLAYSGYIDDGTREVNKDNNSQFFFFLQGNEFLGKVTNNGYVYIIQRDGVTDDFTISKIDPRRILHNEEFDDSIDTESSYDIAVTDSISSKASSARLSSSQEGSREIRVLFLFMEDVDEDKDNTHSINMRASQIITEFRKVLKNSGISLQHRNIAFAGKKVIKRRTPISTVFGSPNCARTALLDDMTNRKNGFELLTNWLNTERADIAFLIFKGHDEGFNDASTCRVGGAAHNPEKAMSGQEENFFINNPFGVSAHNYAISDLTAVHEIGHIFGGLHPEGSGNNRGRFAPDGKPWQTIMGGYNDTCQFRAFDQTLACERIPRFSNQSQTHLGGKVGDPSHDMRSWILSPTGRFAKVAAYREPSVVLPRFRSCNLDADGNRADDALTDGILFQRYMFGLRDEALISNVLGNDCTRCEATEIEAFIAQCFATGTSDIDGNGKVDALTDGILIRKFLFGIRGEPLIKNSVGNNCTRCTEPEIVTYLQGL
jgi:hypothetical protein